MKKLEILVTQYKEGDEVVKNLLDSIELQIGVSKNEIGVIIVNDGSDVFLSDDLFKRYSYDIKYVKAPHGGISTARNNAMDFASAPYVMFCDCDDMFFDMFALRTIFDKMNEVNEMAGNMGFDILTSYFVEEVGENCQEIELHDDFNNTFIHGKVYKLSFLRYHRLRWNDSILCHEDVYFNCLALNMTQNIVKIKKPFYLWKYRKGSITRRDNDFGVETFPELVKSFEFLIFELLERELITAAKVNCCSAMFMFYFFINKVKLEENVVKCEKLILGFWNKFKQMFLQVNKDTKINLLMKMRPNYYLQGLDFEKITFVDWIKRIESYE
ncbi:MAG: glycosyltransferase family 2 protein [Bacilli bacterium]|nr:glycosyltransferase family 2 protein [Bacilli bacterium]